MLLGWRRVGLGWEQLVRASGFTLSWSLQPVGQPAGGDPEARRQMPPPPPCSGMKGTEGQRRSEKQGGAPLKPPFPQQAESSLMTPPMSMSRT